MNPVTFSPNSEGIVPGSGGGTVQLWDATLYKGSEEV